MTTQNIIITKDDPQWLQDLAAKAGYKTKDTKPTGPLFADGRAGIANALFKERQPDSLDMGILRTRAANKAGWGVR